MKSAAKILDKFIPTGKEYHKYGKKSTKLQIQVKPAKPSAGETGKFRLGFLVFFSRGGYNG